MLTMNIDCPGFWISGSSCRAAELAAVWLVTPTGFLVEPGEGELSFSRPANKCLLEPPCPGRKHVSMPKQGPIFAFPNSVSAAVDALHIEDCSPFPNAGNKFLSAQRRWA